MVDMGVRETLTDWKLNYNNIVGLLNNDTILMELNDEKLHLIE